MTGFSVTDVLDSPLYYLSRAHLELDRAHPGVLDVALLTSGGHKVALLFSDEARARAHLSELPQDVSVQRADDSRAKEELLRAALARGAATLWLDAAVGEAPAAIYPLQRALEYTLSYKRQRACL